MSKIIYIGQFAEEFSEKDGALYKDAEMFSTGTHRGVEYTEEDLQGLVDTFSVEDNVPIQLDHSSSVRDTVGFLEGASVKDGKLLGKLKFMDKEIQEKVKSKLMNKLSISFYLKETDNGIKPSKIREVSLVAFPQVKSARVFSENGFHSDYEEKEDKNMTDKKIDLNELTEQIRLAVEAQVADQFSELQTQVESLKGADQKFKQVTVESKIEKFSAENKVVPAQKDALTKLLASFTDEQAQAFDEFMSNSQKVDFSEQGQFGEQDGEEDEKDERSKEQKDFDAFYEEHTKKYGTSL